MNRRAFIFGLLAAAAQAADSDNPRGVVPPDWITTDWLNSKPLTLARLRGKVVLVRWWTAPDCPMCEKSAPVLNSWSKKYRDRGLVVVGLYHHKEQTPVDRAHVESHARRLGFTFPVATDPDWQTLRAWWLAGHKRKYTSVTFLIGRDGKVAHVHSGGTINLSDRRGKDLEKALTEALR